MSHNPLEVIDVERSSDRRRTLALAVLCLAQLMLVVDITVVQVALPSIGLDLDLDREALTWIVTAYTLCFGGLMVLGGRLADEFGSRRMLLAGLTVFTVASLASGLAADGAELIGGRAAQGVGAALLSPAALSIIVKTFQGNARNRALGVWAAIGAAGAALGVLLGGVLTAGPGWQWVFFVNIPIGALVFLAVPAVVRPDEPSGQRQRVDIPGALLVTLATGLVIYALVNAGDAGWAGAEALAPITAALLLYMAFVAIEARAQAPLVRLAILTRRPVVSGAYLMLVATGLLLGLFFLTTLYLQQVRGLSALETGLAFLPVAIALMLSAQLGAHLIGRIGGRPVAAGSFLLTALGALLLTQVSAQGNVVSAVLPGFVIAAIGIGPAFVVATSTTMANVRPDETGVTSGVLNTFHELGGAIGVAVVSTFAASSIGSGAIGGFTAAYTVAAVVAVVTALAALGLVPPGKPTGATVGHGHAH